MLVVGDREAQAGQVAVRNRKHGDQGAKPLAEFLAAIQKLIDTKAIEERLQRNRAKGMFADTGTGTLRWLPASQ